MSSTALRASSLAAAAAVLAVGSAPAFAQADRSAVINILVECAKIDDPSARLACYDNNIRSAGGVVRSTVPGQVRVQGGGAVKGMTANQGMAANQGATGFGRENIKTQERFTGVPGQVQSIRPKVVAVLERQPHTYLVTLEDGAQWVFAQAADAQYRPPSKGAIVEIDRGALGSYLMRVDGQRPVQVLRVK